MGRARSRRSAGGGANGVLRQRPLPFSHPFGKRRRGTSLVGVSPDTPPPSWLVFGRRPAVFRFFPDEQRGRRSGVPPLRGKRGKRSSAEYARWQRQRQVTPAFEERISRRASRSPPLASREAMRCSAGSGLRGQRDAHARAHTQTHTRGKARELRGTKLQLTPCPPSPSFPPRRYSKVRSAQFAGIMALWLSQRGRLGQ